MTTTDSSQWLQDYLEESVANNLCTTLSCTTCGAMDFRTGLLLALARSSGDRPKSRMDDRQARAIIVALAGLTAPRETGSYHEAVRLIIFDIWNTIGGRTAEGELSRALDGTWVGSILEDMKAHHRAEGKRRRAHAEKNDPAFIEKTREEKRRAREQKHAARLAAKSERDRLRRENRLGNEG
jgi:hypothetical protein